MPEAAAQGSPSITWLTAGRLNSRILNLCESCTYLGVSKSGALVMLLPYLCIYMYICIYVCVGTVLTYFCSFVWEAEARKPGPPSAGFGTIILAEPRILQLLASSNTAQGKKATSAFKRHISLVLSTLALVLCSVFRSLAAVPLPDI